MKTILTRLSNEQATKELKRFAIAGLACSVVAFFVLWPLAVVGIAFSGRALLLTRHKGNEKHPKLPTYRVVSTIGFLLGVADMVLYFAQAR